MRPLHAYWNRDGRELWEVTDKDGQVVATLDHHHQKVALLFAHALAVNADLLAALRELADGIHILGEGYLHGPLSKTETTAVRSKVKAMEAEARAAIVGAERN